MGLDPETAAAVAALDAKVHSVNADALDRHLSAVSDRTKLIVVEELEGHWTKRIEDRVRTKVSEQGVEWWATAKPQVETTVEAKLLAHIQQERERRLRKWALPLVGAVIGTFAAISGFIGWAANREIEHHVKAEVDKAAESAVKKVEAKLAAQLELGEKIQAQARDAKTSAEEILTKSKELLKNAETSAEKSKGAQERLAKAVDDAEAAKANAQSNSEVAEGLAKSLQSTLLPSKQDLKGLLERLDLPIGTVVGVLKSRLGTFLDSTKQQWLHPNRYDPTQARWTLADGRDVTGSRYHQLTRSKEVPDLVRSKEVPNLVDFAEYWPWPKLEPRADGLANPGPAEPEIQLDQIVLLIKINP